MDNFLPSPSEAYVAALRSGLALLDALFGSAAEDPRYDYADYRMLRRWALTPKYTAAVMISRSTGRGMPGVVLMHRGAPGADDDLGNLVAPANPDTNRPDRIAWWTVRDLLERTYGPSNRLPRYPLTAIPGYREWTANLHVTLAPKDPTRVSVEAVFRYHYGVVGRTYRTARSPVGDTGCALLVDAMRAEFDPTTTPNPLVDWVIDHAPQPPRCALLKPSRRRARR